MTSQFELVWASIKKYVADRNVNFNLESVETLYGSSTNFHLFNWNILNNFLLLFTNTFCQYSLLKYLLGIFYLHVYVRIQVSIKFCPHHISMLMIPYMCDEFHVELTSTGHFNVNKVISGCNWRPTLGFNCKTLNQLCSIPVVYVV